MSVEQVRNMKRALLAVYGEFADRRIKNIDRGDRFIVDGRTASDIASDGHVYGWFCSMFLEVKTADQVQLTMINLPASAAVDDWLRARGKAIGRDGFRIQIARGAQSDLLDLAKRVEAITARGQRYGVASYKYAVPRVVDALRRLKAGLDAGWADA